MKQGMADRKGPSGRKIEPGSKAINPGGADAIGQKLADKAFKTPLVAGVGYLGPTPQPQSPGPGGGRTVRPGGSQGRY